MSSHHQNHQTERHPSIKNGTFTLPSSNGNNSSETYHIPLNEHNTTTLHAGGPGGYDVQPWSVTAHTANSITFTLFDDALSSFPGSVLTTATYTLLSSQSTSLTIRLVSVPLTETTPIMLSAHNYWNLGAFVSPAADTILNNTLYMPYAKRWIATDGILVPTGEIRVTRGSPLDFWSAPEGRQMGSGIESAEGFCGTGCRGFDNALILDRPNGGDVVGSSENGAEVLTMRAPTTGIEMKLWTNMGGLQIYSCDGLNGTIAVKGSQQHGNNGTTYVPKYGCVVLEAQDVSFLSCFFSLLFPTSPRANRGHPCL